MPNVAPARSRASSRAPHRLRTLVLVAVLAVLASLVAGVARPTAAWAWASSSPTLLTPKNDTNPNSKNYVQDPVFTWTAVPGAVKYEVQVSASVAFTTDALVEQAFSFATAYAPRSTYGADSLNWRVRAIGPDGVRAPWSTPFRYVQVWLQRQYAKAPTFPLAGRPDPQGVVDMPANRIVVTWDPVQGATGYEVQFATVPQFQGDDGQLKNPPWVYTCRTPHTTFTPVEREVPQENKDPRYATSGAGEVCTGIQPTGPRWDLRTATSAAAGGASLRVASTSQPDSALPAVDPTPTPSASGTSPSPTASASTSPSSSPSTAPTPSLPKVTTPPKGMNVTEGQEAAFTATATGYPAPDVQWEVSTDKGVTWRSAPLGSNLTQTDSPATSQDSTRTSVLKYLRAEATDNGTLVRVVFRNSFGSSEATEAALLTVGQKFFKVNQRYYVRVRAYAVSTGLNTKGSPPIYSKWSDAARMGQSRPQVPSFVLSGAVGSASLEGPSPLTGPADNALSMDAPLLTWAGSSRAASYDVVISLDNDFTHVVGRYETNNTAFVLPDMLLNTSRVQAFYWYVLPRTDVIDVDGVNKFYMPPDRDAINVAGKVRVFRKVGPQVSGISPTNTDPPKVVTGAVVLRWAAVPAAAGGMKFYSVRVQDATGTYVVGGEKAGQFTDSTAFVPNPDSDPLPDGVYSWTVVAIDAAGHELLPSEEAWFEKVTPATTRRPAPSVFDRPRYAPSSVRARRAGASVAVTWKVPFIVAGGKSITAYQVVWRVQPKTAKVTGKWSAWRASRTLPGYARSLTVPLPASQRAQVAVRALNTAGPSPDSRAYLVP